MDNVEDENPRIPEIEVIAPSGDLRFLEPYRATCTLPEGKAKDREINRDRDLIVVTHAGQRRG